MADENTNGAAAAAQPSINILAQYTKDFSFENPGAPRSLQQREKAPNINISVNVNANPMSETDFDVVLTLDASAKDGDKVVFHAELSYGGLFRVQGFAPSICCRSSSSSARACSSPSPARSSRTPPATAASRR